MMFGQTVWFLYNLVGYAVAFGNLQLFLDSGMVFV
jgi:hypothetical protein